MVKQSNGSRDIPLKFAACLSAIVNTEWESGRFINAVTPVTADLLRYWFDTSLCELRDRNFHEGQRQAILNTIFVHEVLKSKSVSDMYAMVSKLTTEIFTDDDFADILATEKTNLAKYCVKMATGTGKTWVLNALLVWQYLNAKYTQSAGGVNYTKNFLLVAPGLIVYERLLDSFLGKENNDKVRDFNTCDLKKNEDLFLPPEYRQDVYSFIRFAVADKTEIGHKITGDGLVAITNWHALVDATDDDTDEDEEPIIQDDFETQEIIGKKLQKLLKDLLPLAPGRGTHEKVLDKTTDKTQSCQGSTLASLDARFLRRQMMEHLSSLPDLCVFNDEAHHIHETKSKGKTQEVEWQKSLNLLSDKLSDGFIQIDFSATPFDSTGSGVNIKRHYFTHIISNFELKTAMEKGLVKRFHMVVRDELSSGATEDLDYKSIRDDKGNVIDLSEGQRVMLRAGLEQLKKLENDFAKHDSTMHPKMLVVCEDTKVSPFVEKFLYSVGLSENDVLRIDSDSKGELKPQDWKNLKQQLFSMDARVQPKVVVSVLMLREGFDVNNICVIVPLRSTKQPILLEQVLGRGLRLMWRNSKYNMFKEANRLALARNEKALNCLDALFVIEHPEFKRFYTELDELGGLVVDENDEHRRAASTMGDMITSHLKENYAEFDMFWPQIISTREYIIPDTAISVDDMQALPSGLDVESLKKKVGNSHQFVAIDMLGKTRQSEYSVSGDRFSAHSYNEYLVKMLNSLMEKFERGREKYPLLHIKKSELMSVIDRFIRTRLFGKPFDPIADDNWRILMLSGLDIYEHIIRQVSNVLMKNICQKSEIREAVVKAHYFSGVPSLVGRENYALDIKKSIYDKTFYPSHKGGLEREFLLACDRDTAVERIVKIDVYEHSFAKIWYSRTDGIPATYHPDFMVKIADRIYVVETKGNNMIQDVNVQRKEQGAIEWVSEINRLPADMRMNAEWVYVLLEEDVFYRLQAQNGSMKAIFERSVLKRSRADGRLL